MLLKLYNQQSSPECTYYMLMFNFNTFVSAKKWYAGWETIASLNNKNIQMIFSEDDSEKLTFSSQFWRKR